MLVPAASAVDVSLCVGRLAHHGLSVQTYACLAEMGAPVRSMCDVPGARVVAIIDGCSPGSLATVSALRVMHAGLGIVAWVNPSDEAATIQLLHAGVDVCCPVNASADILLAVVLRLLQRLGTGCPVFTSVGPARLVARPEPWRLVRQGWALRTPEGFEVSLTTGERAFLTTLLGAPSHKLAHGELIKAVSAAYSDGRAERQLGVMVSRMRRKFSQAGAPLPLKSVHNWGYMFVSGN